MLFLSPSVITYSLEIFSLLCSRHFEIRPVFSLFHLFGSAGTKSAALGRLEREDIVFRSERTENRLIQVDCLNVVKSFLPSHAHIANNLCSK